jgi:hypothetical protein
LFTLFEQEIVKDLHHQYDKFNECKLEERWAMIVIILDEVVQDM